MTQLDLFAPPPKATPRDHWWFMDWSGPTVGGYCQVHGVFADRESGGTVYATMEICRLLSERSDGSWLAEIAMGTVHGKPWPKDGLRVILPRSNMWPPMQILQRDHETTLLKKLAQIVLSDNQE